MSPRYTLSIPDFVKGFFVGAFTAVVTEVATVLLDIIQRVGIHIGADDWNKIAAVAATSFLGYLLKNFLTNQSGQLGVGSAQVQVEAPVTIPSAPDSQE